MNDTCVHVYAYEDTFIKSGSCSNSVKRQSKGINVSLLGKKSKPSTKMQFSFATKNICYK